VRDLFYLWLERQGSALIQGSAPKKDAARRNPMPVEKE
jgi:hypothetical protein